MAFRTMNKKIACKPSEKYSMEAPQVKRGFALPDERSKLFEVETLFLHFWSAGPANGGQLPVGTRLYLPSDAFRHEWNRHVYKHADGTEYILVPEEMVIALEYPDSAGASSTCA